MITTRPQPTDTATATGSENHNRGTAKLSATMSFVKNVQIVAAQMCSCVDSGSDSCARWMPMASDIASATATTRMPPRTATIERVPAFQPGDQPDRRDDPAGRAEEYPGPCTLVPENPSHLRSL